MRSIRSLAVPALIIGMIAAAPWHGARAGDTLKVVIIRHAEKPDEGDNLSCQGENRALQLPAVLMEKFDKPDYTYVPALKLGKSTNHVRMLQTVTPLAVKHNLSVNSRFAATAAATVAADVRKRKGVVLTVWDHSHIPALAAALGVRQPPAWDGHDFDSIWVIRYASGKAEMTVDAEGIAPSAQCTF